MFSISKCSMTLATTRGHDTLKLLNSMHKPRGLLGHSLSRRCDGGQRQLGWQSLSTTANGRSVLGHPSSSDQSHPDKIDRRNPELSFDDRTEPTAHFNPATLEPHVKTWLEDPKCCTSISHYVQEVTVFKRINQNPELFSDLFPSGEFQTWTETTSTEERSPPLQDTLKRRTGHCGQPIFHHSVGAL